MIPNKAILLADYSASVLQAQSIILRRAGYEIAGEVTDIDCVAEKYSELMPDLVIVGFDAQNLTEIDFNTTVYDGLPVIKAITEINGNARIIVCSKYGAHSCVIEAIQLGVRDWVPLPLYPDRLLEAVKKVLRGNQG